jgi:hypothetical protein
MPDNSRGAMQLLESHGMTVHFPVAQSARGCSTTLRFPTVKHDSGGT